MMCIYTSHIQIPYTYTHPKHTKMNTTTTTTHTEQEVPFEEKLLSALL